MARILVIDDDIRLRSILHLALARAGHCVDEAANGRQGIRAFHQDQPDLVLCDMYMPEMDGLEVVRELRREDANVKIIAMSGDLDQRMDPLPVASRLKADSILYKPFRMDTLLDLVNGLLTET